MDRFVVGRTYGVLHMDDRNEVVVIAARTADSVQFADGRSARVLHGEAPDGSAEEVIRLGEVGPVATGGVVRACHLRSHP
jgi:hypothetical protein